MNQRSWNERVSAGTYRLLLVCYPRWFRLQYAVLMEEAFRDRWRRESRHGLFTAWRVWRLVLPDFIRSVVAERRSGRQSPRPERSGRRMHSRLGSFSNDIRFAVRSLRKQPGFTLLTVVTLGLGIGANAAIFTVINDLLLNPFPFEGGNRIAYLIVTDDERRFRAPPAGQVVAHWREQAESFDAIETYVSGQFTLTGDGQPAALFGIAVSPTMFSTFGVNPLAGRIFTADEGDIGDPPVVMIAETLWRSRYGADPEIVGTSLMLNDTARTVVGVMPSGFDLALVSVDAQLWVPHAIRGDREAARRRSVNTLALLKLGVPLAQARAELAVIGFPDDDRWDDWNPLVDLPSVFLGRNFSQSLWILLGTVGLVLLVACANVANMLLARGSARAHEIGIRTALGAGRGRVLRLLLAESGLLGLMGAFVGLLIARGSLALIVALRPTRLDALRHISIDTTVLAFTLLLAVLTTLLFGLLPALRLSDTDVATALRAGRRGGNTSPRHATIRQTLVTVETALALIVIVSASLMSRSFAQIMRVDPGIDPRNLGTFTIRMSGDRYSEMATRASFLADFEERVAALPDVASVALAGNPPGQFSVYFSPPTIEGMDPPEEGAMLVNAYADVSPNYFATVGTTVLRGRAFVAADAAEAARPVIVNDSFVRTFWPDEDPLGKRIRFRETDPWHHIVGVVEDVKALGLTDLPNRLQVYLPMLEAGSGDEDEPVNVVVVVRGRRAFDQVVPQIQNQVYSLDPSLPLRQVRTVAHILASSVGRQTFTTGLFTIFALVALVLAAVGTYGVVSLAVNQRVHELGVRIALGAGSRQVVQSVLTTGLRPVILGTGLGLIAAFFASRVIEGMLFDVNARDPLTFILAPIALCSVAVLSCLGPSRRAAKTDPMETLRAE